MAISLWHIYAYSRFWHTSESLNPCKLIVITFSTFIQFAERVQAVLKGVAPDEARLYQLMPDQIPHGRQ